MYYDISKHGFIDIRIRIDRNKAEMRAADNIRMELEVLKYIDRISKRNVRPFVQ